MKYLLTGVAAIAMITACDQSGAPKAEPIDEITLRDGDPAEAPDVISAMMLTNSGDGALSYESKEVDGADATFSNVTVTDMDGMAIESLVFEGLDMVDGQASFSRMSLSGVTFEAPEEADTSTLNVGEIELINPSPALAAWLAGALGTGEPADFPSFDQVSFDAWAVSDFSGDFSGTDAEGTYSLGSANMRNFDGQKAALAEITDFAFDVVDEEDMNFKGGMDSLSVSGADLKFLTALQENAGDEEAMAAAMMNMMTANPMEPGYDRVSMDNFTVEGEGMDFAMPSIDAYVERNNNGDPVRFVLEPASMTLDADADGGKVGAQLAEGLSMIGYEGIELRMASITEYDPDADKMTFEADENYFELVDGARFSYGGDVAGYAEFNEQLAASMDMDTLAEGGEPDPMVVQQAMGALEIGRFELRVSDDSLVDRIFNAVAAQNGQDPEQMRTQVSQMMGMAPLMAQQAGIDTAIATELGTALSSFIQDPKTLTIMIEPEEPVTVESLSAMEDPSMITKDYLGFSASNK